MIKETNITRLIQLPGIRTVVLEDFITLDKKHQIDQLFLYGSRAYGVFKKQ